MTRNLFHHWTRILNRLKSAHVVALFLDYDGTLVRLRNRPEDAALNRALRHTLVALAKSPRFRVWVVSGRRLKDVRERVRIPGVSYLGLQGWEGRAGTSISEPAHSQLRCVAALLASAFASRADVWLEDKEYSLAVHYRGAAESNREHVLGLLEEIVLPFAEHIRMQRGKDISEIIPRELEDKGAAVKHQLASISGRVVPIYLGDDTVDEPAFEALPRGITVRIGKPNRSSAHFCLANVGQVRVFLDKLRMEVA